MIMTTAEYLQLIDKVNETGKYKADWASLAHHKVPSWYMHDKLGVFIHWGIYSVPAFGNEWYSRGMYDKSVREFEHHRKTYGEQNVFVYLRHTYDGALIILYTCGAQDFFVCGVADHRIGDLVGNFIDLIGIGVNYQHLLAVFC